MSRDAESALRQIIAICDESKNITTRQVQIFDLALQGLGLVECQRKAVMGRWQYNRLMAIRYSQCQQKAKRAASVGVAA
jgi:hypothetical protein